jgi:transcriptional regulator with XRE-family HTH domain
MDKSRSTARYRRFLELMRNSRREANLTQQQLADRLAKSQSFIAKYEAGERRLDVVEFLTVAEAMGADPVGLIAELAREESEA